MFGMGMIGSVFLSGYWLKTEIEDAHKELTEKVSLVSQDVAVIKYQVSELSKTAVIEGEVSQAQYVLVQVPPGEAVHRQQAIERLAREVIHSRGD